MVFLFSFAPLASAQTRCECEYDDWVDDCDAEFERKGNWIVFKSDTEQCSRIDWYTDAQPRLTIVEDGKETVELLSIPESAEISIASCKVCKDRLYHSSSSVNRAEKQDDSRATVTGDWVYPDAMNAYRFEVNILERDGQLIATMRQYYEGRNNVTDVFAGQNSGQNFTLRLQQTNSGTTDAVMYGAFTGATLEIRVLMDGGMLELEKHAFRRP